jgi:TPR repeat protein
MRSLIAFLCFTLAVLFGSAGSSWGADWEKGVTAYKSGDYATALREWTPLAEQGDAAAQYKLGVTYEKGTGVIQDNVYAHMWYNIAASSGKSKNAPKNRDIVAGKMTPSQLETAQNLARECVRRKYKGC